MEELKAVDVNKIIKILSELDERDLITKLRIHFEEMLDENYKPPRRVFRKEYYSDSEGSAESEEEYYVETDENGFLSLM